MPLKKVLEFHLQRLYKPSKFYCTVHLAFGHSYSHEPRLFSHLFTQKELFLFVDHVSRNYLCWPWVWSVHAFSKYAKWQRKMLFLLKGHIIFTDMCCSVWCVWCWGVGLGVVVFLGSPICQLWQAGGGPGTGKRQECMVGKWFKCRPLHITFLCVLTIVSGHLLSPQNEFVLILTAAQPSSVLFKCYVRTQKLSSQNLV